MRILVRALLPLGEGTLLDPFMGSGSTIAAAEATGYSSIGIELDGDYFRLAERSIPRLAALYPGFAGETLEMKGEFAPIERNDEQQMPLVLSETPAPYGTQPTPKPRRNVNRQEAKPR
jgi:hypothetical protein